MNQMKGALGQLMRQDQQVQEKMKQAQDELASMEITCEAGAGMVKITLDGKRQAKQVQIDAAAMEEDKEFLEDLIAAAINDASRKIEDGSKSQMGDLLSGMDLLAGMKMPF